MRTAAPSTVAQHNWGQVFLLVFFFFVFLRMMPFGSGCSNRGSQYNLSTREGNWKEQPKIRGLPRVCSQGKLAHGEFEQIIWKNMSGLTSAEITG